MSASLLLFGVVLPWLIVALFVALGTWIGFQLIHQNGRLLTRLETLEQRMGQLQMAPAPAAPTPALNTAPPPAAPAGLPIGSPAPAFELPDVKDEHHKLSDFSGKKLLLVFFNPRCGFCTQMAPALAVLPTDGLDGMPLPLVVSTGGAEENRKLVEEHGLRCTVLLQEGMEVASEYLCHGTPMGYLVDEQGRIKSEMAVGAQALLALANQPPEPMGLNGNGHGPLGGKRTLAESKIERNGLAAGTPAPDFTLPRLDGGELSLSDYRGRKVLLVFSDPKCGPCMALAPELEQRSRHHPEVQVLMVSRGDLEANRAKAAEQGLTFPIGLQRQWEVSRDYAMFGTPIAYLIDEEGVIAAEVAVGMDPILSLLASANSESPGNGTTERCPCGKPLGECGCGKKSGNSAIAKRRQWTGWRRNEE